MHCIVKVLGIVVCAVTVCGSVGQARGENVPTPQELMDQISILLGGKDPLGQKIREQDAWKQVLTLRERLGRLDDNAVSEIESRIGTEKNPKSRSVFVYSLGMIPGAHVDRILLGLFCSDRGVESVAGMQLTWRTEHNGPFTFTVPDGQIEAMLKMVRERPVFGAEYAIRILGMCAKNPDEPIMNVIIARFLEEVKKPAATVPVFGSYTSPQVYLLNTFIIAFSYMSATALPPLRNARASAAESKDEVLVKWLSMALGICRDGAVADYLKEVVLHDPDRYVRCEAIRPYQRAAGVQAIPVLRVLLDDKTTSEYHSNFPEHPMIAAEARAALIHVVRENMVVDSKPMDDKALFEALEKLSAAP